MIGDAKTADADGMQNQNSGIHTSLVAIRREKTCAMT